MKKVAILIVMFVFLSAVTPVYAAGNICNWAESKSWAVAAPGKIGRGLINLCLGWTNIFVQPFKEPTVMSGLGKGIGFFAVRTVQGLGEIVLFWLPPAPEEPLQDCVFYDWGTIQKV